MDKEEINEEQPNTHWNIALDWFQQNNRSISALIQNYLCPKCTNQLNVTEKENPPDVLISAIQGCCSHVTGFITERLPILESVFRLFLAIATSPLVLEGWGSG